MNIADIYNEDVQRVLVAALLGAVIGIEREWSGKSAGFRTLMLVSAGAALFTLVSMHITKFDFYEESDLSRIASNIVTGIGFIGAGIIFRGDKRVRGLTTAATVWVAAAIGMAIGIGDYRLGITTTVAVWIILVVVHKLEIIMSHISDAVIYTVHFEESAEQACNEYEEYIQEHYSMLSVSYEKENGQVIVHWEVRTSKKKHNVIVGKMIKDERVKKLNYG